MSVGYALMLAGDVLLYYMSCVCGCEKSGHRFRHPLGMGTEGKFWTEKQSTIHLYNEVQSTVDCVPRMLEYKNRFITISATPQRRPHITLHQPHTHITPATKDRQPSSTPSRSVDRQRSISEECVHTAKQKCSRTAAGGMILLFILSNFLFHVQFLYVCTRKGLFAIYANKPCKPALYLST